MIQISTYYIRYTIYIEKGLDVVDWDTGKDRVTVGNESFLLRVFYLFSNSNSKRLVWTKKQVREDKSPEIQLQKKKKFKVPVM